MRVQLPPPALLSFSLNDLAYVIGLLATDGNLSPDRRHIQFTTTDYQLAKQFKKCLKIKNKITVTKPTGFGKKVVYRINFGNVKFYRWLEEIGLKANKTHSLGKLKIPKEYMADFLRGHIDGDGSIFTYVDRYMSYKDKQYTYNRLYTSFISASPKHLKWIQASIKEILNIEGALNSYQRKNREFPLWNLRFAKNDSLKLLSWLYYKPDLPCLNRKRRIAERFISTRANKKQTKK